MLHAQSPQSFLLNSLQVSMKQITLSLVWLTIRIDLIPAVRERGHKPLKSLPPSELPASLRARLSTHLLKDIGEDNSGRD
ncbi:hypothetical protein JH26_14865 [Microvirga sp. BSC39]|nr:hypothetical protein JH26_14865 [Microvirga sp. BSC39]